MNKQKWSLRHSIILLAIAPILSVTTIFITQDTLDIISQQEKIIYEKTINTIDQITPSLTYGISTENIQFLNELSKALLQNKEIESIQINNTQGLSLIKIKKEAGSNKIKRRHDGLFDAKSTAFKKNIVQRNPGNDLFSLDENNLIGSITISVTNIYANETAYQSIKNKISILFIILSIAIIISIRFSLLITKPIEELSKTVSNIDQNTIRIPIKENAKYEVRILQRGFRSMAEKINNAQTILKQKVREATIQLNQKIHEIEATNEQLTIEKEKSDLANQAKSRFIANVSHELRTPLNSIIGYTDLASQQTQDNNLKHKLGQIESSSKILLSLINDIIESSEIEQDEFSIIPNWFSPADTLRNICYLLNVETQYKHIHLYSCINTNDIEEIFIDEKRFRQILVNLIGNAIKFTDQGYILAKLNICESSIQLSIEDTGIGIDTDKINEMFQAFKQSDESRSRFHGGSGLGLSITNHIIKKLNGDISATSTKTQGSTFNVSIPLSEHKKSQKNFSRKRISIIGPEETLYKKIWEDKEKFHTINYNPKSEDYDLIVSYDENHSTKEHNKQLIYITEDEFKTETSRSISLSTHIDPDTIIKISSGKKSSSSIQEDRKKIRLDFSVLIVDDNSINRNLFKEFLNGARNVFTAKSGKSALEIIYNQKPSVVLMDIHMPEMDGYETLDEIKKSGHNCTVIAVTADASNESLDRLYSHGFHGVVTKPVTSKDLIQKISEIIKSLPDFNIALSLKQANGNFDLARKMIKEFREEITNLDNNLSSSKDLLEFAHRLSGSARYCGSQSIEHYAQSIEKHIKMHKPVDELISDLKKSIDQYLRITEIYLQ